ncbi:MAG: insulinase family protein, partial [Deinococcus sp.]|nr:insulinase family protein [Deinococcus sp.]
MNRQSTVLWAVAGIAVVFLVLLLLVAPSPKADIAELKAELQQLQASNLAALSSRLDTLQAALQAMQQQASGNGQEIQSLQQGLVELENQITQLRAVVRREVQGLGEQLQSQGENLSQRLEGLSADLEAMVQQGEIPAYTTTQLSDQVTEVVFRHGLRLLVAENHLNPIVTADAWVGTGSIDETPEDNGISHFFEHLLFKGTWQRGVGEIDARVGAIGGRSNAQTAQDFTHYYITAASRFTAELVDMLSDMLQNPSFDPAEVERERGVILDELSRGLDNPQTRLSWEFVPRFYTTHPYHLLPIGTVEAVRAMDRDDFFRWHRTYYRPNNTTFVVSGDVTVDQAIALVGKAFRDWEPAPVPRKAITPEPTRAQSVYFTLHDEVELATIMLGFPAPALSQHPEDARALDVLSFILSSGRTSRLVKRLREELNLVSDVDAGFGDQRDGGLFTVSADLEPANITQVHQLILEELNRLHNEPVTEAELDRAKRLVANQAIFSDETTDAVARNLGLRSIVATPEYALSYVDEIQRLTPADLQRVAARYFTTDGYLAGLLLPVNAPDVALEGLVNLDTQQATVPQQQTPPEQGQVPPQQQTPPPQQQTPPPEQQTPPQPTVAWEQLGQGVLRTVLENGLVL